MPVARENAHIHSDLGDEYLAAAVFAIWPGPKPPSEDLKKGLLG